ncbi:hypothetical protein ACFL3G_08860 [Planctomycetota bacterium]
MKTPDRRNILADLLRYSALAVVGFVTGAALIKRRRLLREGKCVSKGICSGCDIYKDCSLPQALSRKDTLSENPNAK